MVSTKNGCVSDDGVVGEQELAVEFSNHAHEALKSRLNGAGLWLQHCLLRCTNSDALSA
jgi:hypothetical protein